MAKIKGAIVVDRQRCKGCGVCVSACPLKILTLAEEVNDKGYHYVTMLDDDKCTGCASCGFICPDNCIRVYRQKID